MLLSIRTCLRSNLEGERCRGGGDALRHAIEDVDVERLANLVAGEIFK
jgi:hypothetical protein